MQDRETLDRRIRSSDAEERREAAIELGRAGREAVPMLFQALADADWRVRKTAVEALAAQGGGEIIDGLINSLRADDNAGARNSAMEALVQIGGPALDPLLLLLDTPDPDVRKFAVDILGDIRDPRCVPALISRLEDDDENIRVAAAEALGKIRDPRAVDALLVCLNRYDQGWLDYAAAEALGQIGDERALGPLIAALGRSSLREPVLESLGRIGNAGTIATLTASLADPLRIVREVSVSAIAAIYRKSAPEERQAIVRSVRLHLSGRAVDFLEEILETSAGDLLKSTIALLGWSGRERSIHKLFAVLKEEELEEPVALALRFIEQGGAAFLLRYLTSDNALVRRTAARVLGEIGSIVAEDNLIGLLDDENGHVRKAAADALGRIGSTKGLQRLLELLADEYEDVQESAIRAIASIGDESVIDDLVRDFSARETYVRRNIAQLLGRFTTEKTVDALTFALKDEEPDVRKAVVSALGTVSGDRVIRSLLLATTDDDPEVRMRAAEALGNTGSPKAREALTELLSDSDLWVCAAAARALGRTGGRDAGGVLTAHLGSATDVFLLALLEIIGKLNYGPAQEPLLALTDHADPEVRKSVLTALSGFEGDAVRQAVIARLSDGHWSVRKSAVESLMLMGIADGEPLLAKMAESDPDKAVRQAAHEALRK